MVMMSLGGGVVEAGKSVPRREALNKLSCVLGVRIKTPTAAVPEQKKSTWEP